MFTVLVAVQNLFTVFLFLVFPLNANDDFITVC